MKFLSGYNDMSMLQIAQKGNTNKIFLRAPFFSGAFVGKDAGILCVVALFFFRYSRWCWCWCCVVWVLVLCRHLIYIFVQYSRYTLHHL